MPSVSSSIWIPAPAAVLFDLSQDYYLRSDWDPFTRDIRLLGDAHSPAVGVRVWVRSWIGLTMEVEYITYQRPDVAAIKMIKGPLFLSNFAGSWRFRAKASDITEVEFKYSYRFRWRVIRPFAAPIFKFVFGRDVRRRLKALGRASGSRGFASDGLPEEDLDGQSG